MEKERKKTTLHHPVENGIYNSMLGALTLGCWKDVLKTLPLSLASVSETRRCKPGNRVVARVSRGTAEGTMEMTVT